MKVYKRTVASLSGHPIADRFLQSGYRRGGPEDDCDRRHAMVVLTPLHASLHTCLRRAALVAPLQFR
jgi:hypothetical protein